MQGLFDTDSKPNNRPVRGSFIFAMARASNYNVLNTFSS